MEDCRNLDMAEFARKGAFVPWYSGSVRWLRGQEEVASIGYAVKPSAAGELVLHLSYRLTRTGEDVELPIRLDATPLHFGGCRWWCICPLTTNSVVCARRVGKIYLPPGGRYFGCRHCYSLTYESSQGHDKRVDFLRRNPAAVAAILDNPEAQANGRLLLALKARRRFRYR